MSIALGPMQQTACAVCIQSLEVWPDTRRGHVAYVYKTALSMYISVHKQCRASETVDI